MKLPRTVGTYQNTGLLDSFDFSNALAKLGSQWTAEPIRAACGEGRIRIFCVEFFSKSVWPTAEETVANNTKQKMLDGRMTHLFGQEEFMIDPGSNRLSK
jgi:hypothetical protein